MRSFEFGVEWGRQDHDNRRDERCPWAQATTYLATAPKSNRSGTAYWAAVADLDANGALPVPLHLRSAGHPAMKHYGYGVGYRYPPDFEDSDIAQLYLPEALAERRYYQPSEQGYEATIGARTAARAAARQAARELGRQRRAANPPPTVDSMKAAGSILRTRETNRRKLADTEKRDAGGGVGGGDPDDPQAGPSG